MEDTTGIGILERLKRAAEATSDQELAQKIGLSKQAIADAKSRKTVPTVWIPKAAQMFNVTTDWLFFGRGPMRPGGETPAPENAPQMPSAAPEAAHAEGTGPRCERCAKLEEKLEKAEEERRELMTENRQLWKENREISVKLARYEERQNLGLYPTPVSDAG